MLHDHAVLHHDAGTSAEQGPEPDAAQIEHGDHHGEGEQGQDGHDPRQERDAQILHGDGRQVGNDERQDQLRGFQLAHLALSHQADADDDEQI